jgi:hypothetical protein
MSKTMREKWVECPLVENGPVNWPSADNLTIESDCPKNYIFKPTMERWDYEWEIERLEKMLAIKDKEIGALRFDIAILKAELNSVRGRK